MTLNQLPDASPLRFLWIEKTTTLTTTATTSTPTSMDPPSPEELDFYNYLPKADVATLQNDFVSVEGRGGGGEEEEEEEEEEVLPLVDMVVGVNMITTSRCKSEGERLSSLSSSCAGEENSPAHHSLDPIGRVSTAARTTSSDTTRRQQRNKPPVSNTNINVQNNNNRVSITPAEIDNVVEPRASIKSFVPQKKSTHIGGGEGGDDDRAGTTMTRSFRSLNHQSLLNDEDNAHLLVSPSSVHHHSTKGKNNNPMAGTDFNHEMPQMMMPAPTAPPPHSSVASTNLQQHEKQPFKILTTKDHQQTIVYHDSLWIMTTTKLNDYTDHGNHPAEAIANHGSNKIHSTDFPFVPSTAEPFGADLTMWPSDEEVDRTSEVHERVNTTTNEQQLQSAPTQASPTVQISPLAPGASVASSRCTTDQTTAVSNACNSIFNFTQSDNPSNNNRKTPGDPWGNMVVDLDPTSSPAQYLTCYYKGDGNKHANSRRLRDKRQISRDENSARDKPSFSPARLRSRHYRPRSH